MENIVYMNISELPELDSATLGTFTAVETNKAGKKFDISTFATKTEVNTGLAEKQDTISDLESIREGAVAGSTAIQPAALEQIETELNNKANVSDMNTALAGKQNTISDLDNIRSGAAAGAAAYNKPEDGIPASDLATVVQNALDKANNALTTENVGDNFYLNGNNELCVNVGTGGLHINEYGALDMDVPVHSNDGSDGDIMTLHCGNNGDWVSPASPATIAATIAWDLIDEMTTTADSLGHISVNCDIDRGLNATFKGIFVNIDSNGGLDFDGAGALKIKHQVPSPTSGNNGQVLTISSDDIVWADIPSPIPEYTTADAGKVLAVKSDGTGLEWITLPTSN